MAATQATEEVATTYTAFAPLVLVFLGGVNLVLTQWILVRELTTMLLGSELVILLVTVVYFAGLSIGYSVSGFVRHGWLLPLGVVALLLNLTLPVWLRLAVAGLDALDAYGLAFFVLPVAVPFVVSAFFSIFLPLLADTGAARLSTLYAVEVTGSVVGVLVLVVFGMIGLTAVLAVFAVVLLGLLWTLGLRRDVFGVLVAVAVGWLVAFPVVNDWSNAVWFRQIQRLPAGTTTLFTGYSPYQKVDVLEAPDGNRYLFLDGLEHFGSYGGRWLNIMMGRIPASLIQPENALVLGAGSMQMELMIANYAEHVTTVELDPMVAEASLEYLTAYNFMDRLENRTIIIDDAKHHIATTDATYDLIATDLPGAFMIQTGALYTVPVYENITERLRPGGVFVVNLTGDFEPDAVVSRRIAASLLAVFDEVMVVTSRSAGWSFAYAGDDLPFTTDEVRRAIEVAGETQFGIFETDAVRAIVGDAQPITPDSLDLVLYSSWDRVSDRIGVDD